MTVISKENVGGGGKCRRREKKYVRQDEQEHK
jgi:hypothetical protein